MKFNKCFFCNKFKYIAYHMTEVQKDVVESIDMCEICGARYLDSLKLVKPETKKIIELTTTKDLLNFMSGYSSVIKSSNKPPCECGLTVEEFDKCGRFGCTKCYDHFKEELEELVFPYHGASQHVGKKPKRYMQELLANDPVEKEKVLKLKLAKAIELEDYESAKLLKEELLLIKSQKPQ